MKVRFTAEIIDDDGNVIGNRVSEAGGIPCPDDFDLSTKEGFLRDFDKLEKAVLKARNQIGKDIVEETLDNTSKKQNFICERKSEVESGLGRIDTQVFDKLAQSKQPKERIDSVAYKFLASKMCTNLSYRKSVEMINLFCTVRMKMPLNYVLFPIL